MPANNRKQALLPAGSTRIPNPVGTAPGFICPVERGGCTHHIASLPGVPREMRPMAEETLLSWVRERQPDRRFLSRVYSVFGISESKLDELLAGAIDPSEARLSFRAAPPRLQIRLGLRIGLRIGNAGSPWCRVDGPCQRRRADLQSRPDQRW